VVFTFKTQRMTKFDELMDIITHNKNKNKSANQIQDIRMDIFFGLRKNPTGYLPL
jgi:hypothetical protein